VQTNENDEISSTTLSLGFVSTASNVSRLSLSLFTRLMSDGDGAGSVPVVISLSSHELSFSLQKTHQQSLSLSLSVSAFSLFFFSSSHWLVSAVQMQVCSSL